MLLDGANSLFQTLDSFLNLTIRKLDERAGFPELLVQIGSIIGMTPVEMHLKSFGDELELMAESFGQNAGMSLDIGNLNSKSFSGSADDLLNLRERLLVHAVSPYEVAKFMAFPKGSQTALPPPRWSLPPGSVSSASTYCYSKNRRTGGKASPCAPGTEEGMEPDDISVLAQHAVEDSPR